MDNSRIGETLSIKSIDNPGITVKRVAGGFILIVAMAALGACVGVEGKAVHIEDKQMPGNNDAWAAYKALYVAVKETQSIQDIDELSEQASKVTEGLHNLFGFPENRGVGDDLGVLINANIDIKRRILRRKPGKPPRPDWAMELKRSLNRLAVEYRVLLALQSRGMVDAWVTEWLGSDFARDIEVVTQDIENVKANPEVDQADIASGEAQLVAAKTLRDLLR